MTAVTVLLVFAMMAATFAAALDGYTKMPDRDTYTEVGVSPRVIGLGQEALINIMTYPGPSGPTYEAQSLVPDLLGGFSDISITIVDPDGKSETFMPIDETLERVGIKIPGQAEIVGHLQFYYKPSKVGTYSFTASFPGKIYTTDNQMANFNYSVFYKPSVSTYVATLTVVEDTQLAGLLNGYPWSPLPNDFWRNPVSTDNREWAAISGDWVQSVYNILGTRYNPYSVSPKSSHILWSNQVSLGGIPGGIWGSLPYSDTSVLGGIVLDGKIYQTGRRNGYFDCVDLRTGELLWSASGSINGAYRFYPTYQTGGQLNEGGLAACLWSGIGGNANGGGPDSWTQYNPYNGDVMRTITNVPKDIMSVKYEDGSPIFWCIQGNLRTFNTTLPMKLEYLNLIKWDLDAMTEVVNGAPLSSNNWLNGVVWNVSIVQDDQVSIGDNNFRGGTAVPYDEAGVVVVRTPNAMQIMAGYDMKTGAFLWKNNATVLNVDVRVEGIATSPAGPLIMADGASNNFVAYDVKTGKEIWRAPTGDLPWAMLPAYTFCYNNGVTFMGSYDGHVYAYNISNGQLVWKSEYIGAEDETIYGNQPYTGASVGADGVLYYSTATVYRMMPRTRFHEIVAIDEATGQFLWKLPIGMNPTAIAEGYLVATDAENGMQYCIGKGHTTTTVTAPLTTVATGTSVLIQGSVLDMSPGTPNTPAVSDADMDGWMDYLYGQNATLLNSPPMPSGVSVRLAAINQNGDYIDIGTTTSDSSGLYKIMWAPDAEGTYTIYATFDGSNSYWGSYASTALGVTQSAAADQESTNYTWIIIGSAIAIIIAVIVANFLILKKKL